MQNWLPRDGERVFTTPRDVSGFNQLTRLEPVYPDKNGFKSATNRFFDPELISLLDTSLDYGELEIRQATPARLQEWNSFLIAQAKTDYLLLIEWPDFISSLDQPDISILHEALQKIRSRHLPVEMAPLSASDKFEAVCWYYFKIPPPVWCPSGTTHLIGNIEDEIFAVSDTKYAPVRKGPVEAMITAGLITHTYEPDSSLEYHHA